MSKSIVPVYGFFFICHVAYRIWSRVEQIALDRTPECPEAEDVHALAHRRVNVAVGKVIRELKV